MQCFNGVLATEALRARLSDMQGEVGNLAAGKMDTKDIASTCILEEEQQQDCDLIVMGKRGRGALEEMLLGSVSKHILLQSSADVLITDRASGG